MTYKKIKKELGVGDNHFALMFGYKNANSLRNSSRFAKIKRGVEVMYEALISRGKPDLTTDGVLYFSRFLQNAGLSLEEYKHEVRRNQVDPEDFLWKIQDESPLDWITEAFTPQDTKNPRTWAAAALDWGLAVCSAKAGTFETYIYFDES